MSQVLDDSLEAGRDAARRRAWRDAYELLGKANEDGLLGAEDLEQLAEAAWWTSHLDEAIDLRERAYAAYVETGEPRCAAPRDDDLQRPRKEGVGLGRRRMACTGSTMLENGAGRRRARSSGPRPGNWCGDDGPDLAGPRAPCARPRARHALRRSEPRSDGDGLQGTTLVMSGQVSEGLALLDEATAAAVGGELEPLATGMVYCVTIHSCQTLGDCGRAAEWDDRSESLVRQA